MDVQTKMIKRSKSDLKCQVLKRNEQNVIKRPVETEALLKHFDQILEGNGDVCFVVGVSGIGKTTFVEHTIKALVLNDVKCIYGKFRKQGSNPFSTFSDFVEQIVKQLLTLPFEQLESVKRHCAVFLDLILILCSLCRHIWKNY